MAGAIKYAIPEGTESTRCRSCGATIYFVITDKGKRMPTNADGTSHFASCDDPKRFRKKDRKEATR